jgi:hypothetical protein
VAAEDVESHAVEIAGDGVSVRRELWDYATYCITVHYQPKVEYSQMAKL